MKCESCMDMTDLSQTSCLHCEEGRVAGVFWCLMTDGPLMLNVVAEKTGIRLEDVEVATSMLVERGKVTFGHCDHWVVYYVSDEARQGVYPVLRQVIQQMDALRQDSALVAGVGAEEHVHLWRRALAALLPMRV